jgi:hypothetical protein
MAGEDIQNPKYAEGIREAFASYLEEYAKVNKAYVKADNLDNAFELLYDYYRLGNDADTLSRSVAVVSNPNFIREEASRKFNALKKIHENRKEYIQKSVDKFFELIGLNDVFSKLKDLGVAIHPQEALAFNLAQGNYKIKRFVKADTLEEIAESNPLMEKINKIMSDYQKEIGITAKEEAKTKAEEEAKKEEEIKKETEEAKKAETKPVDDILAGLDSKTVKELRDAYNDIERDDKESFEEFLDSPQAKRIIAAATRGKEPEEKAEVPTTPAADKKAEIERRKQENDTKYEELRNRHKKELSDLNKKEGKKYADTFDILNVNEYSEDKSPRSQEAIDLANRQEKELNELLLEKRGIEEDASKIKYSNYDLSAKQSVLDKLKKALSDIYFNDRQALDEGFVVAPKALDEANKVGGESYSAHGMGKTSLASAYNDLINLFTNGINPLRGRGKLDVAALSGGISAGETAGNAYMDGPFTLVANRNHQGAITDINQIGGIIVNEGIATNEVMSALKELFPNLIIESTSNTKSLVEQLNAKYDAEQTTPTTPVSSIEGQVGTSNYSVDSGLIFYNNPDGTVTPVANSEGKPVMDVIIDDIKRRKKIELESVNKIKQLRTFFELGVSKDAVYKGKSVWAFEQEDLFKAARESLTSIINAKYDAELAALKSAETKKESELPGNIEPVKPEVEAELTEEEVNILIDLEPKSPFAELDPLYSADEFILTEDGKFYFNQSKPKQKAKRVSELKPEFSGDKRKGAIAAERGNIIDFLIRRFFEDRITADNINSAAEAFRKAYGKKKITFEPGFFDQMFENFQLIKEEFDQKGWTIVSNLPTLFGTLGVDLYAGTTDLLARDKDGNYFIIDLKTSGSSRRADYEKQLLGESNYGYSTADRIQQNAYRELLKQRTGIEVKGLFILPLIVDGNIGIISGKFNSVELDTPADGSYLLPIDMSKNIYEIVPDKFTFEQVEQIEQEFPVSPQVVGKIVYASPGIGKSTLVSQYPNQFVDMDQLLAEEFTSLGYEGFTADNVGSKVYDLFRTADYDEVKSIVDNAYRNAFDRAKEMTKTGVTVLTGSPRFLVGKGSMRYVDLAVIASDENIIRKQLERRNPQATPQEITDLVNRIRTDEKNANVLIEVNSDEFISFIQGTLPISSYIINANTNSQILNIEKLIPVTVSEEDLAIFMAKKQLMLDRKQMFEQVEAGDIVELSINDGKDTVALVVDRVIPYYKNQTKILFKPNSNKIKDLIPSKSFSIVSISKANIMPTKPDVSEEAEKNAKDNVTKMDDFTSETDRLKKLLEEDFNEDDLFNGAEDPINCNI